MSYTPRTHYGLWLAGAEVAGSAPDIAIEDPASGTTIAMSAAASPEDVEKAVQRGEEVFRSGVWSRMAPPQRAAIMSAIGRKLAERVPDLAVLESLQTGRPLREMSIQLGRLPDWFEYFGALCRTEEGTVQPTTGSLLNTVKKEPLGVCALITSFNHPMLISVKKLAPALAAGNSVIIKPSDLAPLSVLELGQICKDAGLPDGVLSILPGGIETGKALVSNARIKKVDLTGGTPGGRAIGATVGANLASYTAELGGKAPVIVFSSANLDLAVNGVAFAAFIASGQTCVAATRILVQREVMGAFLDGLKAKCASIEKRIGSPFNATSMMGPIISQRQLSVVETLVEDARERGAQIVCGGKRMSGASPLDSHDLSKGYFYPPTLITSSPTCEITCTRIWREEAFGPALAIVAFDTEDEAISLANDSEYGLGSAIWTRDGAQGLRVSEQLEVGICWINTHHRNDPSSAWGGVKASGVGRENGYEAYNAYKKSKSVIINYASDEECLRTDDWFREGAGAVRYG